MALKLNKNWIVLGVALVTGALAAFGARHYFKQQLAQIEAREKQDMVQVVVAKTDLEKGSVLSPANVAARQVPKDWSHSGAITPEQFTRAEGAVLAYPALAGEPILWAQLEGQRLPTFSARLTPGRRAVTIPVDEVSSLSGMLEPGDLIDLVVSVKSENKNITLTLLQGVTVLATGTRASLEQTDADGRSRTYTAITLDTTPEEARRVIAAREIGRITALLRAPGDRSKVAQSRSDALALLGLAGGSPVAAATGSSVPVIYGGGPIAAGLRLGPQPPAEDKNLP